MSVTRKTIAATRARIAPYIRRTPVIDVEVPEVVRPVTLKLEVLQHTGSFKARGAFASLAGNPRATAGVAAASGGNHGAAVAYAARRLGLKARIFVPAIAAPAKLERIRSYGAAVVQDGANYAAALALCEAHIAATGAMSVHAYDETATVTGQGSVALELEDQSPDIDTVLVAVGGGGLIGGIAAWYCGATRVVAVEPRASPALHAALAAGRPVDVEVSGIAADSLGATRVGELPFAIAGGWVERAVLVDDGAIRAAQAWLWESLRLVTEPGGATAFAALLAGAYRPAAHERVAVVLCGANTDPETFARAIA